MEQETIKRICLLVNDQGQQILDDPNKFKGLMLDYCYDIDKRDLNVLTIALQQKIPRLLLSLNVTKPTEDDLKPIAHRLAEDTAMTKSVAIEVVHILAIVLGVIDQIPQTSTKKGKISREALNSILYSQKFSTEKLIELLTNEFGYLYSEQIGVWEGYSLEEHTLMVLGQFEKYFSHRQLPGNVDKGFFRLILALHDIAVPVAIQNGDKSGQFKFVVGMIEDFLKALNFSSQEINLAVSLVGADPIGTYIKVMTDNESDARVKYWVTKESYDIVLGMAAHCSMSANTYFDLLLIYYMVDAGSYTADAGGQQGLDWLFIFKPGIRAVTFSPDIQAIVNQFKYFISPGPGCMWVNDHELHSIEFKFLKNWVKKSENIRKMDNGEVVWGSTFTYGKYRGQYHIKLRPEYDVAFYSPDI